MKNRRLKFQTVFPHHFFIIQHTELVKNNHAVFRSCLLTGIKSADGLYAK